jgi:hypothetical protein
VGQIDDQEELERVLNVICVLSSNNLEKKESLEKRSELKETRRLSSILLLKVPKGCFKPIRTVRSVSTKLYSDLLLTKTATLSLLEG